MTNPKEVLEWLEQQKNRPPRTIFDEITSSKERLAEFIYMVSYACSTCDKTNGGKVSPYCQFCKQCLNNDEDALFWLNWPAKKLTLDNPVEEDDEEMEGKETNEEWFDKLPTKEKAKHFAKLKYKSFWSGFEYADDEDVFGQPNIEVDTIFFEKWLKEKHEERE